MRRKNTGNEGKTIGMGRKKLKLWQKSYEIRGGKNGEEKKRNELEKY